VFDHFIQPGREKPGRDVLDGIEPKPVCSGGVEIPLAPAQQGFPRFFILEIDRAAHQMGEIAFLQRDLVVEVLALEQIHLVRFTGFGVVIGRVEMPPVPLERRIASLTPRKVEMGVDLDFPRVASGMQAVVLPRGCKRSS